MSDYVIDASVAAKWFFPEEHSELCQNLLSENCQLMAPELIWSEVGNIFWKRFRRGEITAEEASQLASNFSQMPIETDSTHELLTPAVEIALSTGITVYDAMYVSAAIRRGCPLVTADEKLNIVLANTPFSGAVRHISTLEVP
jgi:predicted nucleic acid-binding protein